MGTIAQALLLAEQADVSRIDARALLRAVAGVSEASLRAFPERQIAGEAWERYAALLARRAAGEPVAYLTGRREFYGLEFEVNPAVLIPRPETELLVDWALERMPVQRPCRVLDLGTGSGCIGVTIAKKRPHAVVTAADISADALQIAGANAKLHGLANIEFVQSDWFAALEGQRFDVILANPPYVALADPHLGEGDLRYEPCVALVAGGDGLGCIRAIAENAPRHMNAGGLLAVEHGYNQGSQCRQLLGHCGFVGVTTRRDLAGIERATGGELA